MKIVVAVADLLARSRIEAAASARGHEVVVRTGVPAADEAAPDLLIVDLDAPGALDALEGWRAGHPSSAVTGFAFHVNAEVIERARLLGVRVLPHGADPARLFA